MDMNTTTDNGTWTFYELCIEASRILNTPGFAVLLVLEGVFGLSATILNILLILIIWRVKIFHINLRFLLIHFSISLAWYSGSYAAKAFMLLPRIFTNGDPCDFQITNRDCRIQETPYSIPVILAVYCVLSICLERMYSTLRYEQYSDGKKYPILALILIPLCYVMPVFNILDSLMKMTQAKMAFCEGLLSMKPASAQQSLINNLVAMIVTMICVASVWYWNGCKLRAMMGNKARHTLSSRFQIDQNIQMNRIIVPDVVLQLCCYIPNYIFMFLILVGLPLTYEWKTILIHVNYLWKIGYALAHAAVMLKRNTHIQKRLKEFIPAFLLKRMLHWREEKTEVFSIVAKQGRHHGVTHFQMLEDAWKKAAQK